MDKAADKIEAHIDRTRERLGSNLRELEQKVEAATDWREQFRARPHLFLGGAFAGGALLAATFRHASRRISESPHVGEFRLASQGRVDAQRQVLELWDDVKGALLGVASAQITRYIGDLIPGFDEHYRQTARRPEARRELAHE
jgi:hypothetical protein